MALKIKSVRADIAEVNGREVVKVGPVEKDHPDFASMAKGDKPAIPQSIVRTASGREFVVRDSEIVDDEKPVDPVDQSTV